MQILLNIKNEKIFDKLLWMLEHFKSDGVEIVTNNKERKTEYSDEYIEKNWKSLVSKGLSLYDESYYKSEQYKIDRANYLMEKYKWM